MSTIVTDTITGKSTATTITIGSTPIVSASANSMTIRGEGTAQTSIQQGLAKSYVTYKTSSGVEILNNQSFNHSSLTDISTGATKFTMTSAMSQGKFPLSDCGGDGYNPVVV